MIGVTDLTKKYGNVEAVRGVSFSVGRAEVLGFLGPNGAGKTTIMKILAGFHYPSGGRVEIDGISVEEDPVEIKKRVGYLPESVPLYGDMSAEEYLYFAASARLIPKAARRKAVENAVSLCGLEGYETKRIETLSKGYRQRTGLAQAVIHDPPILILDEPASGLDPNQIVEMRSLIRELGKRKTVILSTHILQEVEAVCSRVLILNGGRIAAQGTPEEIAGSIKGAAFAAAGTVPAEDGVPVTSGGDAGNPEIWELRLKGAALADIGSRIVFPGWDAPVTAAETLADGTVRLEFSLAGGGPSGNNPASGELIFDWAVSRGYKITGMARKKPTLEDIFAKLTGGPGKGESRLPARGEGK